MPDRISLAGLRAAINGGQIQVTELTKKLLQDPEETDNPVSETPPEPETPPKPRKARRIGGRPSTIGRKQQRVVTPMMTRGMVRYVAQIDGHGFVKKETVNGVEELTTVEKRLTATRFLSREAAMDAALSWGKLNGKAVLRDDVKIVERIL